MERHDRPLAALELEASSRELPELPPPDTFDPVIEAYKKDVDRTLLVANLRLTPNERSQKFQRFMEMVYELHRAEERRKMERRETS
jgi:hypothetical protein